ncbi:nitrogenase component 1 [Crateriforma spongiae]|nr:nitrogenase component 1 [Crateriforma spongiae]
MMTDQGSSFVATRNACKMCTPLGACLAFSGVEGCLPFLHGSQGCSTYIRRYLISHFREPMDIASSNFDEQSAIFGGQNNLSIGLRHVLESYRPKAVGIATTCLSETIGDDVSMFLNEFRSEQAGNTDLSIPPLIHASTPSYHGSHFDGYTEAVAAIVDTLAEGGKRQDDLVNILPFIVSPADLRHLREIVHDFRLTPILTPDYSDRLDGPPWQQYQRIPDGGTPIDMIRRCGTAAASIQLGDTPTGRTAAGILAAKFDVPAMVLPMPIGVRASDQMFGVLEKVSGRPTPQHHTAERGRLVDSYIDAHKYIFGKRAIVFGDEDFVVSTVGFLAEIGIQTVLCGSGGQSGTLKASINRIEMGPSEPPRVIEGVDFEDLTEAAADVHADLMIGHSKGYKLARQLGIPLVRIGLPVHDRFGASRMLHVGYRGTQQLFDRIVNTLLEQRQDISEMGYTYL